MKKLLFVIAAAAMSLAVSAQNKGDMYVSGSMSISGGNSKSSVTAGNSTTDFISPNAMNFTFIPEFGYFVMDRLDVHLGLGYSLSREANNVGRVNAGTDEDFLFDYTNLFQIAPGVRYYFTVCDRLYYTPGLDLALGFGNYKTQVDKNTTEKSSLTTFGLSLSLARFEFRPCEHLGVTLSAGDLTYLMTRTKAEEAVPGGETTVVTRQTDNSVNFGLNLGAEIGFRYYF